MHRIPPPLAPAVYVPGLIYEALVRARARLYSASLLPQRKLPAPVISIGNITMGGTGKTPLVIHVARLLTNLGCSPAILTRGYGRSGSRESLILRPGEAVPSPAETLGDEPALIRRHLPLSWLGVSKDRFEAGAALARLETKLAFLLDDGFQHRKLYRDLDIVVIDGSQPLTSNRLFPRGTLREPVEALRRGGAIVINNSSDGAAGPVETEVRNLNTLAEIFHCRQTIGALVPFAAWEQGAADGLPRLPRSACLAAALGNPDRFLRDVRDLGIEVRGTRFYRDHHALSVKDWQDCIAGARGQGADVLIITEKDAVKISRPPDFPLMVAVQSIAVADAGAFERTVKKAVGSLL